MGYSIENHTSLPPEEVVAAEAKIAVGQVWERIALHTPLAKSDRVLVFAVGDVASEYGRVVKFKNAVDQKQHNAWVTLLFCSHYRLVAATLDEFNSMVQ